MSVDRAVVYQGDEQALCRGIEISRYLRMVFVWLFVENTGQRAS